MLLNHAQTEETILILTSNCKIKTKYTPDDNDISEDIVWYTIEMKSTQFRFTYFTVIIIISTYTAAQFRFICSGA